MKKTPENTQPRTIFVEYLPDLITEEDYLDPPEKKKIRVQIKITEKGVEILGDSIYAPLLEKLLAKSGAKEIEKMLCG